jgi:hypothetical protein
MFPVTRNMFQVTMAVIIHYLQFRFVVPRNYTDPELFQNFFGTSTDNKNPQVAADLFNNSTWALSAVSKTTKYLLSLSAAMLQYLCRRYQFQKGKAK